MSAAAMALIAAPGASAQESTSGLEEIIIVAEKREANIQDVPLAVTAVSAETLDQANINQLADINGLVPGLTIAKNEGAERVVSIRGVGYETAQNASSQPGVSFHIDGVYVANSLALNMDLLDVSRVEVLRGPQGTVFGQSSTGGAINVISNAPTIGSFGGEGSLAIGDYDLVQARATLNVPITDVAALRFSGQSLRHGGYADSTHLDGYDLDDADTLSGRVAFLLTPTPNFSITLAAQNFVADQNGAAQKNILDPNPDPRVVSQDYPSTFALDTTLLSATLQWTFGDMVLKSITGYQETAHDQTVDNDRVDLATVGYYDVISRWRTDVSAFTQEINLSSQGPGPVSWIAGVFYLSQEQSQNIVEFYGTSAGDDLTPIDSLPPGAFPPANLYYQTNSSSERDSLSLYGQATWRLTDRFSLTAGARYTDDEVSSHVSNFFDLFGGPSADSLSDEETTGKLEADFDLTDDSMIYASISRGYKPGGVNINQTPAVVGTTFEPETVTAYELGSKNFLFGQRLRLNAAAFYSDYENFQFQQEDPIQFQGGVSNIPQANIWGAEIELSWLLTDSLRLDANATTLDGEFTEDYFALDALDAAAATAAAALLGYGPYDPVTIGMRFGAFQNTKGGTPPKLPDLAGSIGLTHTLTFADGGVLTSHLDYVYRGEFQYRVFNDAALDTVPAYEIVNAYLGYAFPNAAWSVSLAGSNLFDEDGVNSRFSNPFGTGTTSEEYVPPRQLVARVTYNF